MKFSFFWIKFHLRINQSAICEAVEKNNTEIVKLLLTIKNIQICTTALFVAINNENIDIIKLLLASDKLDINYIRILIVN